MDSAAAKDTTSDTSNDDPHHSKRAHDVMSANGAQVDATKPRVLKHRKKLQTQPELDDDAWKWLVEKRGCLPPTRSIIAWPELAANRSMPLNGYPATKEFAAYKLSQDPHEFRWYSYRCPPERFLDDPVTAQPLQTKSLHFLKWLSHMERYHPS
ncbi:uncharacterized protein CTHT_0039590 [Thermochaetoides thermophila DSM 1495]|uniref:Uncharacterized protein n=1 Tax=Chaetomium thermophilum (strain DSM 1495 / CBS 144.50 / IMI 039719) TaxID=759272 RepID=G0S4B6_CHATD|nr:hypothetical protein CTHT_0039590 [Thermochaetoides thermophila DSM 1495]EGS22074.1 hypothetical protein CTHT_0039590 [Thermochaetoides thermophila DSM 1495]